MTALAEDELAPAVPRYALTRERGQRHFPKALMWLSSGPFVLSVLIAFLGLAGAWPQPLGGDISPGQVTLNGVPLSGPGPVKLNLSVPVRAQVLGSGAGADEVRLSFLIAGHSIYSMTSPLATGAAGAQVARIDASLVQYGVAGRVTAQLTLLRRTAKEVEVAGRWRFVAETAQPAWLSLAGVVILLLLILSGGYTEQLSRALRRGERRWLLTVGVVGLVAVLAIALSGLAWLTVGRQPTLPALICGAVLGGAAGVLFAFGIYEAGRSQRAGLSESTQVRHDLLGYEPQMVQVGEVEHL